MATIERVIPFWFSRRDAVALGEHRDTYLNLMESIYGSFADLSWLDGGTMVSYHDMADTIARELAPELADVDLVITVQASPDCRQQSFPGCRLVDLMPGDPFLFGISEQGIAGPFVALRLAVDRLARGDSRRALILILEQATLPPDAGAILPAHDVAVAMLVGPDGVIPVGRPVVTVAGRSGATAPTSLRMPVVPRPPAHPGGDADVLVVGAGLADLQPGHGVSVVRGGEGHTCAGVWLALAGYLEHGEIPEGTTVLVTDQDPVLPYVCSVDLALPVGASTTGIHRERELVR